MQVVKRHYRLTKILNFFSGVCFLGALLLMFGSILDRVGALALASVAALAGSVFYYVVGQIIQALRDMRYLMQAQVDALPRINNTRNLSS